MKFLYKVTNKISGKLYVGVTINPARRFQQHKSLRTNCSILKNAIKKYDIKSFSFDVLCSGSDDYIDDLEVKAIQAYSSQAPSGYNMTLGGDGARYYNWDDDWNSLLGTQTDSALAKQLEVTYDVILERRSALNIPSFRQKFKITPEYTDLLKTLSTKELSKRFAISETLIQSHRQELGIKAPRRSKKIYKFSESELEILYSGTLVSEQAKLLGKSPNTVLAYRKALGICRYKTSEGGVYE